MVRIFDSEKQNKTAGSILLDMLIAFVSLFVNGYGVYLTIHADIGAAPWDVFNLGLSNTFHILYGNASVIVSFSILLIDILLREPIGLAMFIDALTVGKAVDLFEVLNFTPKPHNPADAVLMIAAGLFIIAYTQYTYMAAALGCGPRDTLLVGLKRRLKKIPIGAVSIALLSTVTLTGWLLGGPVGLGTLICAFLQGPIMQLSFYTVRFNATNIRHQGVLASLKIVFRKRQGA